MVKLNEQEISIDTDPDFTINEDDIDGELCKAGRLLCFYGDLAAELKGQALNAKTNLEYWDATASQNIRSLGQKITEGNIKEKVLVNPERKEHLDFFQKSERDFQKIENLYRSQQKKVDCVIALAYKQRTEIAKAAF